MPDAMQVKDIFFIQRFGEIQAALFLQDQRLVVRSECPNASQAF